MVTSSPLSMQEAHANDRATTASVPAQRPVFMRLPGVEKRLPGKGIVHTRPMSGQGTEENSHILYTVGVWSRWAHPDWAWPLQPAVPAVLAEPIIPPLSPLPRGPALPGVVCFVKLSGPILILTTIISLRSNDVRQHC